MFEPASLAAELLTTVFAVKKELSFKSDKTLFIRREIDPPPHSCHYVTTI